MTNLPLLVTLELLSFDLNGIMKENEKKAKFVPFTRKQQRENENDGHESSDGCGFEIDFVTIALPYGWTTKIIHVGAVGAPEPVKTHQ